MSCSLCIAIEQFPVLCIDEHFSSIKFLALLEEWLHLMMSLNKINSKYLENAQLIELSEIAC